MPHHSLSSCSSQQGEHHVNSEADGYSDTECSRRVGAAQTSGGEDRWGVKEPWDPGGTMRSRTTSIYTGDLQETTEAGGSRGQAVRGRGTLQTTLPSTGRHGEDSPEGRAAVGSGRSSPSQHPEEVMEMAAMTTPTRPPNSSRRWQRRSR